ncbi:13094_t:CDS:2, partial [Ambispora leptoticha]
QEPRPAAFLEVKLVQELKNYEVKTSKLSPAARAKNKEVDSSTKYCPTCGNMFGTVAKKAEINTQIDQNRRQVAEKGGTYEYYEEEGTKADGTTYSRIGSKYTGPTK